LPLLPPRAALMRVDPWGLVGYAGLIVVTLFLRSARWHFLVLPVTRVPLRLLLEVNWLFFGANMILPLRLGELVRPALLARLTKISWTQALSMSAAERIIDGALGSAILLSALALSTPLDPLPDRIGGVPLPPALVPGAGYAGAMLFGTAFAVAYTFYRWRNVARRVSEKLLTPVSARLASTVSGALDGLADGLRFLSVGRLFWPFLAGSVIYWLCSAWSLWLVMRCAGLNVGAPESAVVLGMLSLGLMVPGAPGYFGAFQFSVYAALALFVPPDSIVTTGAVAIFWMYCGQILLSLVCMLFGLRALVPARPTSTPAPVAGS
jgi:glycosyltransferase 2 family protein